MPSAKIYAWGRHGTLPREKLYQMQMPRTHKWCHHESGLHQTTLKMRPFQSACQGILTQPKLYLSRHDVVNILRTILSSRHSSMWQATPFYHVDHFTVQENSNLYQVKLYCAPPIPPEEKTTPFSPTLSLSLLTVAIMSCLSSGTYSARTRSTPWLQETPSSFLLHLYASVPFRV